MGVKINPKGLFRIGLMMQGF